MISGRGALVDLAHDLKGAAQTLAHLRNGQAVVGLEGEDGGITVVGGLGQVFGEGNAKELLDDVGDFSKYWPQNDGQHARVVARLGWPGQITACLRATAQKDNDPPKALPN